MPAPRKYPLELLERAVRMYRTSEPKPVIRRMAEELGGHHEAPRNWIRQAEADAGGQGDILTTAEREKLAALRRGMPSSSGRTRSCGRPRILSRRNSTRSGPGAGAPRRAPAPGGRVRTPGPLHPLLHLLPLAPGRDRALRTPPPEWGLYGLTDPLVAVHLRLRGPTVFVGWTGHRKVQRPSDTGYGFYAVALDGSTHLAARCLTTTRPLIRSCDRLRVDR
ncbi:transposase [Streptomyces sp. NPDC003393]